MWGHNWLEPWCQRKDLLSHSVPTKHLLCATHMPGTGSCSLLNNYKSGRLVRESSLGDERREQHSRQKEQHVQGSMCRDSEWTFLVAGLETEEAGQDGLGKAWRAALRI